jgi:hypothetical protein
MERLMPQPNDLSRSLVALDQNSTIIAVVEMSEALVVLSGGLQAVLQASVGLSFDPLSSARIAGPRPQ